MGGWPLDRRLDMFGKWDFVRSFWSDPCDAPFSAYALTMGGAALEAFVLLNQLDLSDVFWQGLQTGTGIMRTRSGRKGIKGSKAGRWFAVKRNLAKFAPDPNEQIGRFLGQFSPLAKRPMPGLLGGLWLIFNILELANYLMFLLEVIAQFMFRWASLMFNSRYCQARDDAVLLKYNDSWTAAAIFPETAIPLDETLKQRGPITAIGSTVSLPPGWSGIITLSCPWVSISEPPATEMTIRIYKNGVEIPDTAYTSHALPDQSQAAAISYELTNGGTYQVTYDLNVGFALCTDTYLYCQAQEPKKKGPV